ncbi:PREDICTED: uncharacterized protein K02A2.6-like [Vollenhovia emeryi]|uniref:uncharacterized protein K02A2.6-like n=1 Tax=Vollenhovia emeryi TaxID=411798 RepID=UPI0005F44499|nr:PREDICTED: uncharacterized protein K02A2.6-like [Vollenhovia emeryi]
MRAKVREYINNCLRCIEFSPPSGKAEGYLHGIPKENVPFATIHLDHIGPLEKTGKGYRHLLVIIDAFTKFIRLYPCKSTTTEETIKHLGDYVRAYSRPRRLISDRGTCFTSEVFEEFVRSETIEHVLVAVSTPRANGQVERYNRMITPMLAKLCEAPSRWDRVLDKIEFSINNTVCRVTGETPTRLLFGIEQRGHANDSLREIIERNVNVERNLDALREKASRKLNEEQRKGTERYNLRRKAARKYTVGEYVEIRNVETAAGINKKLIPKYKGPYVIKKVLDHDRYVVVDIEGFQLTQRPYMGVLAPDQMCPYIHS